VRYKTFNATGIAPDGRLYAGDLNGIQDLYLPLSDFTSTVDVGTLRVGDPTLQLYKYGAGAFRMTGAMIFDGISYSLGGVIAGQFTTAGRDALPIASRPYGLVILNVTTNQYQWNKGTANSPIWESIGGGLTPGAHAPTHAPGAGDPIDYTAVHLRGTLAARPAAAAGNNGLLYFAHDTEGGTMYRSTGSAWEKSSPGVAAPAGIPPGVWMPYGGASLPAGGWLWCDGAAHSRTTYSALFANIGTNYGIGDGVNTFNVPDMWGRVAVGKGTKTDIAVLGYNEGLAAHLRNIRHTHRMYKRGITDGGQEIAWTDDLGVGTRIIKGSDNDNVNTSAYLTCNWIIKT
jgi:hypothetical protein